MVQELTLPTGVRLHGLQSHLDERGSFTEIFREEWTEGIEPIQWNFVRSAAGSMRGVHVHVVHDDVVIALEGRMTLGLRDVRESSPTAGTGVALEILGSALTVAVVPHGVVHGFLFHEPTTLLVGVTRYFDPADDLECLWSDPELQIPWPTTPTLISVRDRSAAPLSALLERIRPWQPFATDGGDLEVSSPQGHETLGRSGLR
jgi:dTDP-4-dehydrorhamnose 3,5-epimerase